MAQEEPITCPMCGFSNEAGSQRCVSCGAKLMMTTAEYASDEGEHRRYQQDGFDWRWVAGSAIAFLVVEILVLVVLPILITPFDPMGITGLVVAVGIWFVGGIIVGVVSPGKTFMEPAVGALVVLGPTIIYQMLITPEGFDSSLLAYLVVGLLGAMWTLFGAFFGEKLQISSGS
ncbi:MAG: zinc finger Ran-binding domain-containing family 2 protein [Myxococcales bacterium]|nr:MAG: zinc finger Ran-binding domain-containing family 2 protein [Myxococcales bacterium]